MEENKVIAEKRPTLWLAILCAVGLGLAGCLLWGLLYYVGYIAWIAAFVVVWASAWGYKKFNLKMDIKGYIIVSVISVVEIILTIFIVLAIVVSSELGVGLDEGFYWMFEIVGQNAEVKNALIIDVVLSVVMIVLAFVSFFFAERKMAKKANNSVSEENPEITVIDANSDKKTGEEEVKEPLVKNNKDKKDE
ncbi:MAG: hypothetical protein ACI4R8_00865 [Candidatus Caccovivens sp.]